MAGGGTRLPQIHYIREIDGCKLKEEGGEYAIGNVHAFRNWMMLYSICYSPSSKRLIMLYWNLMKHAADLIHKLPYRMAGDLLRRHSAQMRVKQFAEGINTSSDLCLRLNFRFESCFLIVNDDLLVKRLSFKFTHLLLI